MADGTIVVGDAAPWPCPGSREFKTEILAGLTTFLAMSYILFVQPAVLSRDFQNRPTGLEPAAVFVATAVSAAVTTAMMGLYARLPIALAPGMGENFFFVTCGMGLTSLGFPNAWRTALGIVFWSGFAFVLLNVTGLRERVLRSLSPSMCAAISAGIGLFLTFIGLKNASILTCSAGTWVALNTHADGVAVLVFSIGLLTAVALQARARATALLGAILVATAVAWLCGRTRWTGWSSTMWSLSAAGQFDLRGALSPRAWPYLLVFLFMDLFDTVGTLVGVLHAAGWSDLRNRPSVRRALMTDAVGTVFGAFLGTSTVTSYIESAAGIHAGARTGLAALVTAIAFLLSLGFAPLVGLIANYPPITASALVIVGALMMANARQVEWSDLTEAVPALLVLGGIPLTFSIADGLALGLISWPLLKIATGRWRQVPGVSLVLAAVMAGYFAFVRSQL